MVQTQTRSLKIKTVLSWIIQALCIACLLTSCRNYATLINEEEQLPRTVKGSSDKKRVELEEKLARKGVQVVTMGQDYVLNIPAKLIFYRSSPRIRWESYDILNEVAAYLKQFRKVGVNVTGFTERHERQKRDIALSTARSRVVENYLASQAIDARLIISEGLGSDKPMYVEGNDTLNNARIEITFRNVII